jgi:DNA gyrase subunit A
MDVEDDGAEEIVLGDTIYEDLKSREQFLLTMANDGFGKRSSAYDYRVTGRGGKGIENMNLDRGKKKDRAEIVAAFPVEDGDQVVLVSDGGQLIRSGVHDIRITGRRSRGVTVFRVAEEERVVSVARIDEDDIGEDEDDATGPAVDEAVAAALGETPVEAVDPAPEGEPDGDGGSES